MSADAKRILMAGWIDRLRDDSLDGVRWGRLAGEVRSVAGVVVGADEGCTHGWSWPGRGVGGNAGEMGCRAGLSPLVQTEQFSPFRRRFKLPQDLDALLGDFPGRVARETDF